MVCWVLVHICPDACLTPPASSPPLFSLSTYTSFLQSTRIARSDKSPALFRFVGYLDSGFGRRRKWKKRELARVVLVRLMFVISDGTGLGCCQCWREGTTCAGGTNSLLSANSTRGTDATYSPTALIWQLTMKACTTMKVFGPMSHHLLSQCPYCGLFNAITTVIISYTESVLTIMRFEHYLFL